MAEEPVGGNLGVGALDALAGHLRRRGKDRGRLLHSAFDGLEVGVCGGRGVHLLAAGGLHEELHEDLRVG